jgi:hypothetical protein
MDNAQNCELYYCTIVTGLSIAFKIFSHGNEKKLNYTFS